MKRIVFITFMGLFCLNGYGTDHSGTISSDQTWSAAGNPHYITADLTVSNAIKLTIEPGCSIYVNGNYQINIYGALDATGTAQSPIIFTSGQGTPAKGDWKGLNFNASDAGTTLSYVTINFAGNSSLNCAVYFYSSANASFSHCNIMNSSKKGIYISGSNPTFSDCTISYCDEYGAEIVSGSPSFSSCTFSNCSSFPISTIPDQVKNLSSLTLTSNTNNEIKIASGTLSADATWSFVGSYYIAGDLSVNANLTLTEGQTFKFNNCKMNIYGTLNADGTSSSPITFTSAAASPAAGDWGGLYFYQPDNACLLDYCNISYGGKTSSLAAPVYLNASGTNVTISNCNITNSYGSGIYCNSSTDKPTITDNSINNNGSYAMELFPFNMKNVSGNTFSGNTNNGIKLSGGSLSEDVTWNQLGDIIVTGDLQISNSTRLTLSPGMILKFSGNTTRLLVYGALTAIGTSGSHITFTSAQSNPSPGDWNAIYFNQIDAQCTLTYCDILYVGYTGTSGLLASIKEETNSFSNLYSYCTISYSASKGIYINASSPSVSYCTISQNNTDGIYCNTSGASFSATNNTINNNLGYPIVSNPDFVDQFSSNTFSGNTYNKFRIFSGNVSTTATWTQSGPYLIDGDITVDNLKTLTISAGLTIYVNQYYYFLVYGTLVADGSDVSPIVFTSNQSSPAPGDWAGIYFFSADAGCILDYCEFYYAGYSTRVSGAIQQNSSGTNVSITNCIISYSQTSGIYSFSGSDIPLISSCNFTNNTLYGINIFANGFYNVSDNSFTDNSGGDVLLRGASITGSHTWTQDGNIIIGGDITVNNSATLNISPGITFKFNGNYKLTIYGTLIANANAENPITFTSVSNTPGSWIGIDIYDPDAQCTLNYCNIYYAGSTSGINGNIRFYLSSQNDILTNCNISNGSSSGVYIQSSTPVIKNCIISNNAFHGIYLNSGGVTLGSSNSEWNEIKNNTQYGFYNNLATNVTAEYIFWGTKDANNIKTAIYDKTDNATKGTVDYIPYLNSNHNELTNWYGTTNTDWNTAGNWDNGVPSGSKEAYFPSWSGNMPDINTDFTLQDMEIASGKTLQINSGKSITVTGTLINSADNNGIIIQSSSSSPYASGALITSSSVSGTMQRYANGGTNGYIHFVSPTVSDATGAQILDAGLGNYIAYSYNTSSSTWEKISSSTSLSPGIGYYVAYNGNKTINFQGTLNTGNINVSVSSTGTQYNLVGNPYPCRLDADAFVSDADNSEIAGSVYLWSDDHTGGSGFSTADYAVWNKTGGSTGASGGGASTVPNQYIEAGQGFWVYANSSGTLTFKNSHKSTSASSLFYTPEIQDNTQRIWLNLKHQDSKLNNNILIGFLNEATAGNDRLYDAPKLRGNANIAFYSLIPDNEMSYIIQGLPPVVDNQLIPLGYFAGFDGNFSISIDSLGNFPKGYKILLEDTKNQTFTNLRQRDYSFGTSSGEFNNRFVLHIVEENVSVNEPISKSNSKIRILGNSIYIYPSEKDMVEFSLYNICGQLVRHESFSGEKILNIALDGMEKGCYLYCVKSGQTAESGKIVLK